MQFRVVCGKCYCDPEVVPDPNGADQAVCPQCGLRDYVEDAQRIAGQHFIERKLPTMKKAFGGEASGKNVVKLNPKNRRRRVYRWHGSPV